MPLYGFGLPLIALLQCCRIEHSNKSRQVSNPARSLKRHLTVMCRRNQCLYAWSSINGAHINVIADPSPVSSALPNSLQLTVPAKASGPVGFGNSGYYGLSYSLRFKSYLVTIWVRHPSELRMDIQCILLLQVSGGFFIQWNSYHCIAGF